MVRRPREGERVEEWLAKAEMVRNHLSGACMPAPPRHSRGTAHVDADKRVVVNLPIPRRKHALDVTTDESLQVRVVGSLAESLEDVFQLIGRDVAIAVLVEQVEGSFHPICVHDS